MAKFGKDCFINRELSWLEFNSRVLRQATQEINPLLERMKYLSIVYSNLDEYFMIRVGSMHMQIQSGVTGEDCAGFTPKQQLAAVAKRTRRLYKDTEKVYSSIRRELEAMDIRIIGRDNLDDAQSEFCKKYFLDEIYPLVSPVVAEKGHIFPFIPGKALNLAVLLDGGDGDPVFATIQLPSSERLIELPSDNGKQFITLEELVRLRIKKLFPNRVILAACAYRLTRNGDLDIDETGDMLSAVKKSLLRRSKGVVVRLETQSSIDPRLRKILRKKLHIVDDDIYETGCPVGFCLPRRAVEEADREGLFSYKPFTPAIPPVFLTGESMFDIINRGDMLLFHPYDSFGPVVWLLREAAADPAVAAIKMTLYRLSKSSPIVEALVSAAQSGKQVLAFIEARARFDEENNIEYGAVLEKAGVSVIYGLPKLKTHSKILLILRREQHGMRKYMHLGTGNYNDTTARLYTDYSLLTANQALGADCVEFFRTVTGGMNPPDMEFLCMAPFTLRSRLEEELREQRRRAKKGLPASVFIKVNSLTDERLIKELYKCSCAGVRVRLLVRGICCLRPGVDGLSENIEVRSIVGRFLEHSRVYIFGEGEEMTVMLSSADMMIRNLDRRVELLFPLLDRKTAAEALSELETYWSDNVRAMALHSDGKYSPVGAGGVDAQEELVEAHANSIGGQ